MVAVCRNTNIIPIPFHDRYGWNTLNSCSQNYIAEIHAVNTRMA